MANVQAMAAAGYLTASRQAVIFLTLEKNQLWWTTKPLLSGEVRVSFPPSKLVWEHYPGQGIEIQWLGTFGEGNGYYLSGHENSNLHPAGRTKSSRWPPSAPAGIAWEYMFRFDGGVPPWTSGLSQGTGLQLMARAWSRFKEPAYLTAAQQAIGIFRSAPPQGVRVATGAGANYAEYTYAPSDRILNGFIQALIGLYDYTSITKDPVGLKLFEEGDAEARAEVPHYDTGFWSLYDQYGESDLNYHELLTEFLLHLCERTRKGPPIAAAPPPPAPVPPAPTTTTPVTPGGGTSPGARAAGARSAAAQIAGDQIYCTTAQRFTADEQTPPAVSLLSTKLLGGHPRGREDLAVEDLDGDDDHQAGNEGRVEQPGDRRRGQAEAALGHSRQGGHLLGDPHRRRPRGQLLDRPGHPHRQQALARGAGPRLGGSEHRGRTAAPATDEPMTRIGRAWAAMSRERRLAAVAAVALLVTMFTPWYGLQSLNRKNGRDRTPTTSTPSATSRSWRPRSSWSPPA